MSALEDERVGQGGMRSSVDVLRSSNMIYRARATRQGWKVERLEPVCSKCGDGEKWSTVLYAYMLMSSEDAELLTCTVADLLNGVHE